VKENNRDASSVHVHAFQMKPQKKRKNQCFVCLFVPRSRSRERNTIFQFPSFKFISDQVLLLRFLLDRVRTNTVKTRCQLPANFRLGLDVLLSARYEVFICFPMNLVPSWERARTQHDYNTASSRHTINCQINYTTDLLAFNQRLKLTRQQ